MTVSRDNIVPYWPLLPKKTAVVSYTTLVPLKTVKDCLYI